MDPSLRKALVLQSAAAIDLASANLNPKLCVHRVGPWSYNAYIAK